MQRRSKSHLGALAVSLQLLAPHCRKSDSEFKLNRLIDELGEKNLLKSPLINLPSKFPRRGETVAQKDLTLISADC